MIDAAGQKDRPREVLPEKFYLTVGRQRGYKGTADLIAAFERMPERNLVVVGGVAGPVPSNVTALSGMTDAEMRWLYSRAEALLSVSREDFGLSPLEANAFGTPALLVRAGGFLDSLDEDVSGRFFSGTDAESIVRSIETFPSIWDHAAIMRHASKYDEVAFRRRMLALISADDGEHGQGDSQ